MQTLKNIPKQSLDCQRRINNDFGELIKFVYEGNQIAAEYLYDTLQIQVRTFNSICKKMPELFKPIACNKSDWPGFITTDEETALHNLKLAKKLKLGLSVKAAEQKLPKSN